MPAPLSCTWKPKDTKATGFESTLNRSCPRRSFLTTLAAAAVLRSQSLAPYVPTPMPVVDRMLRLGNLKHGEKMFDLGSGDGRIVILAAKKFGADATGIEIDKKLAHQSS